MGKEFFKIKSIYKDSPMFSYLISAYLHTVIFIFSEMFYHRLPSCWACFLEYLFMWVQRSGLGPWSSWPSHHRQMVSIHVQHYSAVLQLGCDRHGFYCARLCCSLGGMPKFHFWAMLNMRCCAVPWAACPGFTSIMTE